MTHNAASMTYLLAKHFDHRKNLVVPCCYATGEETDLLIIWPSGWAEEVEVKISVSDFRAEWKKKADKHEDMRLGRCTTIGYRDTRTGRISAYHGKALPPESQLIIRDHRVAVRDQQQPIRRFHFAFPTGLTEKLLPEVPDDYGVLEVNDRGVQVIRKGIQFTSARKTTEQERQKALSSCYYRYWDFAYREHRESKPPVAAASENGLDWLLSLNDQTNIEQPSVQEALAL